MELTGTFQKIFNKPAEVVTRSPGRVNLLGEHVDYNGGPVLPAAIDRSVHMAAARTEDGVVSLAALDLNDRAAFRLDALEGKMDVHGKPLPTWARYPAAVAWALMDAGLPVSGMQAVYRSEVPIGAGLSSSAAVEVGFAVTWQALDGWQIDRMEIARLCQRAENVYVGVNCGLMDQFACIHGVEGHALYFDTRNLEWEPAPLPTGTAIVIADTGVRRSLANSAYNERRSACEQAVSILQEFLPQIRSLRDVSPTEFAAYSDRLPPIIRKRAEHVVKEIVRVQSAVNALNRADTQAFGALMYAGHASLRDLYEVSIPELDTLVRLARELPGSIGARLTGAGFGGCTVNLVDAEVAGQFMDALRASYGHETGRQAQVYLCRSVHGAMAGPAENE